MIKFLIQRPIAVFMFAFALVLMGIVSSFFIPISLMPDIPIPEINIQVNQPQQTAREIENNTVRPLRNQLLQVSGLKDIISETRDGFSEIKLLFDFGVQTDYAFIEVNEKIDQAMKYLPREVERPLALKASASDIPIFYLTISGKNYQSDEGFLELSDFAESVIKSRLEQLPGIAMADISGFSNPEIVIIPDQSFLKSLNLSHDVFAEVIQQNNYEIGDLKLQEGNYQYNLRLKNRLLSVEDIEDIYININGRLFQIKDIAQVKRIPSQEEGKIYFNGQRALAMAIIKQSDARLNALKKDVHQLISELEKEYSELQFDLNQDQSEILEISIDNLISSLILGGLLAIFITFLFSGDFQSPLVIAASIPTSLVISLLFLYILNISINIVSLSGLILGVGMMIDNSIIVIHVITNKMKMGRDLENACIEGAEEVISPLLSSAMTTCSVFIPLIFLSGISGALFYDQAITITIGLGVSFLVSITFIPTLFYHLNNREIKKDSWLNKKRSYLKLETIYENVQDYFEKKKYILFLIAGFGILGTFLLMKFMPYAQLPEIDKNDMMVRIDWNDNVTIDENKNRIYRLIKDIEDIDIHFLMVGEQQFLNDRALNKSMSESALYLKTISVDALKDVKKLIQERMIETYPEGKINIFNAETVFDYILQSAQKDLKLRIYSKTTNETTGNVLSEIQRLFSTDQYPMEMAMKQQLQVTPLHTQLSLFEVEYSALVQELRSAFGSYHITDLIHSERIVPVKFDYDYEDLEEIMNSLMVKNKNGKSIPINQLVEINTLNAFKSITANRLGEYIEISGFNDISDAQILKFQDLSHNHPEMMMNFDGGSVSGKEQAKELFFVIIVGLLLLYFIIAAQFDSLLLPIIILIEIPVSIGGGLFFLWLFNGSINIMAGIGLVVLCGLVINDSILKVHTFNLLRTQGYSLAEAIRIGGEMRLNPFITTSLTTILALTPIVFMEGIGADFQRPLALTIIGGMIVGTFMSLFFVPELYRFLYKAKSV